jgi:hypothetical protein
MQYPPCTFYRYVPIEYKAFISVRLRRHLINSQIVVDHPTSDWGIGLNMTGWVDKEYSVAEFGDYRLNKRGKRLLSHFIQTPTLSIPQSCKGWSETHAAYRFFNNPKVTVERVLSPHIQATRDRMRDHEVVLVIQDTTELDYSGRKVKGAGPLDYDDMIGFLCHTSIAVTPERVCLGVVATKIWSRNPATFHKRKERKKKPIEEKESYRWVEGYTHASRLSETLSSTQVVSIADREADIYECYVEAHHHHVQGGNTEWIIRSYQDRSIPEREDENTQRYKKVWDTVASSPVLGKISFTISGTKTRKGRVVHQTLRAHTVTLKPPFRKGRKLPSVVVNVVIAREDHPPAGEDPIEWKFMTSLPIETFDEVCVIIDYYLCRWQIEIFFKVLKTGCAIERLQFEDKGSLLPCLAMYMIIAWRVLFVMMLGRTCPDLPCAAVFEEDEWKAAYCIAFKKAPPEKPPPLSALVLVIAQFGGYLGRKSDRPPGPKALWTGLQCLYQYTSAWKTFHAMGNSISGD